MIHDVIAGSDEWLFLNQGSNASLAYLSGSLPIATDTADSWFSTIRKRKNLFPKSICLICPEKLAVFPERVPELILDERRLALRLASTQGVVYPANQLNKARALGLYSYPKSDTHFSDLGAWVVARLIAAQFEHYSDLNPRWAAVDIQGDLGYKLTPVATSKKIVLTNVNPDLHAYDNGLRNRGRISLYKNEKSPKGKLLLFGDSFSGINLAKMLSIFFGEVLFVHSLSIDFALLSKFNPDYLVTQFAERFLRERPVDGIQIESLILNQAINNPISVGKWRERQSDLTLSYIDWKVLDFALRSSNAG